MSKHSANVITFDTKKANDQAVTDYFKGKFYAPLRHGKHVGTYSYTALDLERYALEDMAGRRECKNWLA